MNDPDLEASAHGHAEDEHRVDDGPRAGDRALVRTIGATTLVCGGALLQHGLTGAEGVTLLVLGGVLGALGLLALRAPDVLWVSPTRAASRARARREATERAAVVEPGRR